MRRLLVSNLSYLLANDKCQVACLAGSDSSHWGIAVFCRFATAHRSRLFSPCRADGKATLKRYARESRAATQLPARASVWRRQRTVHLYSYKRMRQRSRSAPRRKRISGGRMRSHTSPGRMPGSRRRRSVFGSTLTLLDDASSGGYRTSHSNPRRNHMDSEYSCSSPASYRRADL